MRCKVCERKYHHCTNCDSGGIPWEADGCCSGDCYYEWAQAEIERLTREPCEWTEDECGLYLTSCGGGRAWQFVEDTRAENGVRFCPFCGGEIQESGGE